MICPWSCISSWCWNLDSNTILLILSLSLLKNFIYLRESDNTEGKWEGEANAPLSREPRVGIPGPRDEEQRPTYWVTQVPYSVSWWPCSLPRPHAHGHHHPMLHLQKPPHLFSVSFLHPSTKDGGTKDLTPSQSCLGTANVVLMKGRGLSLLLCLSSSRLSVLRLKLGSVLSLNLAPRSSWCPRLLLRLDKCCLPSILGSRRSQHLNFSLLCIDPIMVLKALEGLSILKFHWSSS